MSKSILMHGNQNDSIEITVYYKLINKRNFTKYVPIDEEEYEKLSEDLEVKDNIGMLKTWWRPQTWHTNNRILNESKTYSVQTETSEFDIIKYQQNLLKYCLVSWDMVDDNNQPIEINEQNIGSLPNDVAVHMIEQYNSIAMDNDEETKKK